MQAVVLSIAVVVPLALPQHVHDLPPPIGVTIKSEVRYLPLHATFGEAVSSYGLQARSGNFLDVTGKTIVRHAYPGQILLDGHPASRSTELHDGDEIRVVNGHNRREGTVKENIPIPGRHVSDPQFYLGTTPGVQVIVKGRVSGKLVSSVFQPTGPTFTPPAVALTFDDGPNPVYTPQILAILQKFHVPATFFTIGYEVAQHPELVQDELDAGMVVGNHSWDHPTSPPFKSLPVKKMRSEMRDANIALDQAGDAAKLFRPPGGSFSDRVVGMASRLGMRVVLWSIDPQDWRNDAKAKGIVQAVLGSVHAGSIVLLHDGGGYQDATVKALPKIIKGIRKLGLRFVSITP
ncbi:MAG: polysaccharide deacetylase family protein [Actinomycetota bacterium]|nr:polysaccharide deacetylase family protein [Actinomycetota bacterium]